MYQHILIATDGSELAAKAAAQGLDLANALKAKATVLMVSEPWDALSMAAIGEAQMRDAISDYEAQMAAAADRVLGSVAESARKLDVPCTTIYLKERHPAEGIIETAQAQACDLIVMASHGRRGLVRFLLGSVASQVIVLSQVPVLICR